MKLIKFNWFLITLLFFGCASNTTLVSDVNDTALEELIEKKSFEIVSSWAQPLATSVLLRVNDMGLLPPGSNPGNINLIGNPNFFQLKDSIVKAYLPFYGERRMGGSYSNIRSGIQFDDKPLKYVVKKGKKNGYQINFNVPDKYVPNESYSVQIQIFPNLYSIININSSHLTSIQYRGKASNIKLDSE